MEAPEGRSHSSLLGRSIHFDNLQIQEKKKEINVRSENNGVQKEFRRQWGIHWIYIAWFVLERERDPRRTTLGTEHVTLKSKLQLGGENNVATKLIKMGPFHQRFYLLRPSFFFFFFSVQQNIIRHFASAERTKARAQIKWSDIWKPLKEECGMKSHRRKLNSKPKLNSQLADFQKPVDRRPRLNNISQLNLLK